MNIQAITSFAIITSNPVRSRKLFIDALALPLKRHEGDEYYFSEQIAGSNHFGVWPLSQAAQSCFGTSEWPNGRIVPQACVEFEVEDTGAVEAAGRELEARGFALLHPMRTEPWGQTIVRVLSPEGVIVGISYAPWLRDRGSAGSLAGIAERDGVRSVVTRLSHEIDARSWPALRSLFAETVTADYRSLFGGEVRQQKADDLIEGWRRAFTPVRTTQHILGPVDVDVQGAAATARCHVRAYHIGEGLPGGDDWLVAGNYVFDLGRTDGGWKIRAMKLETSYQSGNRKLLEEAGALAASAGAKSSSRDAGVQRS
jgi:hypothetical protein